MSDYEKVIEHIRNRCNEIKGEWNGDESGKQEDAAMAEHLYVLVDNDHI